MHTDLLDPTEAAALLAIRHCLDQGLLTRSDVAAAYAQGGVASLARIAAQRRGVSIEA